MVVRQSCKLKVTSSNLVRGFAFARRRTPLYTRPQDTHRQGRMSQADRIADPVQRIRYCMQKINGELCCSIW